MPILVALLIAIAAPPLCAQDPDSLIVPGNPQLGGMVVGEGTPTIIVLHGGPALPHYDLDVRSSRLRTEGRVVYYDQRGCGLSAPAASYHWRDHVADLDRIINHVAPGQPVVLFGGSWGAKLALLYALEHPERVRAMILRGITTWTDLRGGRVTIDSVIYKRLYRRRCGSVAQATWESLSERPGLEQLRSLQIPTLLISGSEDAMGAQELATVLPLAQVVLVPGAGHLVDYEQPDRFFAEVRRFLSAMVHTEVVALPPRGAIVHAYGRAPDGVFRCVEAVARRR